MGWVIFIVVVIVIIAAALGHHSPDEQEEDNISMTYLIDDQDPENPMHDEMQEEFFDEFER